MAEKTLKELYVEMLKIRRFEELVLRLFSEGKLFGTTHCYIGQEANAAGILRHLNKSEDVVVSNHRCHGHYIAFTGKMDLLLSELMGKATGVCGGVGGSQHLYDKNFFTNGIQGGMVPFAAGIGLGKKLKGDTAIAVVFIGDGTFGQGIIYEAFNLMALWDLPVLVVLENNFYAQSTNIRKNTAGDIYARLDSFGISKMILKTTDVEKINEASKEAVSFVRENRKPFFLGIETYRFCSHSKSDDFRCIAEIEIMKQYDPLIVAMKKIQDDRWMKEVEKEVGAEITSALRFAEESEYGSLSIDKVKGY
jgi:TPP-dependent pyruvate/acetoin dehydrogenase alpha subunit